MAIIVPLKNMEKYLSTYPGFSEAFHYLAEAYTQGSETNQRIMHLPEGSFEKVELTDGIFALEQVYMSKERPECFFESHRKFIDIQFIIEGSEKIDVCDISRLTTDVPFDATKDLIKYLDFSDVSTLLLKKGDIAIFFPEDAHMPCLQDKTKELIRKTVVKVPVRL